MTKPRAKLAALLEGRAASCSADSIFAISAGAIATLAFGRQIDEAARQLDVARGQRLLDLARRDRGVEVLVEREFRKPHRIVRRRDRARRIDAVGQAEGAASATSTDGEPERERDGEAG